METIGDKKKKKKTKKPKTEEKTKQTKRKKKKKTIIYLRQNFKSSQVFLNYNKIPN